MYEKSAMLFIHRIIELTIQSELLYAKCMAQNTSLIIRKRKEDHSKALYINSDIRYVEHQFHFDPVIRDRKQMHKI